ncbi:sulfite exporter TauE/SafE family protein [Bengtsoniella intestinalis]|uniref:sulfite exporter TauE/SafE family protein n=1 Tax=Bengtsoniella intestinalis TaxID=3073143 RepID=UPI00391FAB6A
MSGEWMVAFGCALGCGVLTAWGVGGGTLLLLVMTLVLGIEQQTAQGINLLFFLPSAAMALWMHHRQGFVHVPTLKTAIPWGVVGAVAGAWLATGIDTELLRRPFGIYLLVAGVMMLVRK